MCPACEGFSEKIRIHTPGQYFNLLTQVKEVLAQGTLVLLHGNTDLADLGPTRPWPDDLIEHTFECPRCHQQFRLAVETYHGSGGSWQPIN